MNTVLLAKNENIIQILKDGDVIYALTNKNRILCRRLTHHSWQIVDELKQFNA